MAEKILNTRILLKYDTYANWMQNNPILKAGEMAIATVESNDAQGKPGFQNLPNVVLKVGQKDSNGELQRYSALPFVSALAADVHGWAKAADKPTYGYTEITGLEEELARVSAAADTDTQYKLVVIDEENYKFELQGKEKSEGEDKWTSVGELDLSGIVSKIAALEAKFVGMEEATVVAHVQKKIEALDMTTAVEAGAGEIVYYVNEADGVVEAKTRPLAPTDFKDDLVPEAAVAGLTEALAALEEAIGDAEEGSLADAKAYTDEKIADLDYTGGEFGASKFVTKVTQADGVITVEYDQPAIADIQALPDKLKELEDEIKTKQDILYFTPVDGVDKPNNTDNRVATEKYVINAVADLNGAMHFIGKVDSLPTSGEGYNAGDVIMVADAEDANVMVEYVLDKTGTWQKLGHESIYELKADANSKHEAINKAIEDLGKRHDSEMDTLEKKHDDELLALDEKLVGMIEGLDTAKEEFGNGRVLKFIEQADGAVTYEARDLATEDFKKDLINQDSIKGLVTKLNEIDQAIANAESDALQDAKDYSDAQLKTKIESLDYTDIIKANEFITSVSEADGIISVTRRGLETSDFGTGEYAILPVDAVIGLPKALEDAAKAGTDAAAQALTDAKAYTDQQLQGLENKDAAVEKHFVTEVKQADGAITVQRAPVADIALTGNVNDLVQTTGDVLVFNCGNSAVDTAYEFVK